MADEQDWCLECGNAVTTRVVPPPSWRLPAAIVAGGLLLLAAVVVLTVSLLSDDADEAARAPTPAAGTTTAAEPRTTAATPGAREATGAGPIPIWPSSRRAYTVIAFSTANRQAAERRARTLIAGRQDAGVFRTNGYDFFERGLWVTWVGVHRTRAAAERVLPRLKRNNSTAYVTLVRKSA
jgi:hypothetical protein